MSPLLRTFVLLTIIFVVVQSLSFFAFNSGEAEIPPIELIYSDFINQVRADKVLNVVIFLTERGIYEIEGVLVSGVEFTVIAPNDSNVSPILVESDVVFRVDSSRIISPFYKAIVSWLPMLALIFVFVFFIRRAGGGAGQAIKSVGSSRARDESGIVVSFDDVGGIDEAKQELEEIVEFLKEPERFQKLGARIPKGVLLVGPTGTGKTLLARAVAGESHVPFFSISGSDFVEMFVGVGASRVRDLFEQAEKNAPCIVFVDEIDAVGRRRGAGLGGGHDEREQTLNQLLVEMDGFAANSGVIIMAATNRPDVLDPALLRPGRFDRRVIVDLPDIMGRLAILLIHARNSPLVGDIDLKSIARATPGFTGADIENLVNEAALLATRRNRDCIMQVDFEESIDKVLMGPERKSMVISDQEKRVTAYHEAGHAIVAHMLPDSDPLHKVTIIPRGQSLGLTQQLPLDDRRNYSRSYLLSKVRILLGGRIAEELVFNEMTTGASNDLEQLTDLVRRMVVEWGMSEELGPISLHDEDEVFLARNFSKRKNLSQNTAGLIDGAMKKIADDAYSDVKAILKENLDALHAIAGALLVNEILDGKEVAHLIEHGELSSEDDVLFD